MFNFAWPMMFILLPLPLLFWLMVPRAKKTQTQALRVPHIEQFINQQYLQQSIHKTTKIVNILLLSLCWILIVIAAARPQWTGEAVKLPVSGRDLIIAVDLSGSMEMEDMLIEGHKVNRLIAVKHVLKDFILKRRGDRLGLILFADHAYLQTPLTYDSQTVSKMLQESEIGLAGKKTAIGESIGLAIKRIKDLPAQQNHSRVMILLTDGANTAGISPLQMAKLAAQLKLKIYTIGVGADEVMVRTIFGSKRVNPSQDLDEKTLNEIATITSGKYFRARDTEALKEIYEILNRLEPIESEKKTYRPVDTLFHWPLGAALLLSFIIVILNQMFLRKL